MGADLLEGEVEITEFEAIEVKSIKGVPQGANGFPVLMMKGLPGHAEPAGDPAGPPSWHSPAALLVRLAGENPDTSREDLFKAVAADGTVDEQPDIDGGQQAIALIARLIGYEAQELEAGCLGETWDIQLLCDAIGALRAWLSGEVAGQMAEAADGTGVVMDSTDDAAKAGLSSAAVNDLPDSAFAYIEDGGSKDEAGKTTPRSKRHFPVHDKAHADNAAARIAQGAEFGDKAKGKVAAAQRKFGESDAGKSAVAEGETAVDTDGQGTGSLSKAVEDALAKALGPLKERLDAFGADLAKVMAAPVPGGPVLSAVRATARAEGGDDWAAKAAYFRTKAEQAVSPADRDGYRQLAREADEKAQAAPVTA